MSEEPGPEAPVRDRDWRMILLAVLALVGVGVLVLLLNLQTSTDRERDAALERQAKTYEVIIRAGLLSGTMAQAEASLGRYVVSGNDDKELGQQFSDQWGEAANHLARLEALTRSDPRQQATLKRLRTAFEARGKELTDTALYSVFKRDRDALGRYYQVRATPARAETEAMVQRVIDDQRKLLLERKGDSAALADRSRTATRVLGIFGLIVVIGAVMLGYMTVQAIGGQALADADADAERLRAAELAEAVDAATAQLRAEMREREAAQAQLRQAQKMDAVGQLTGGIAHDFNNMLAVVLGGLELAKRRLHTGGADAQKHIENAMEGANRAAALTRRLLAFSREEALLPSAIEAHAVIEGMANLLDRTLGGAVTVETRDDGLGWVIWADRHQLENALLNLAVNARDAMNARGTLSFATGGRALAANEIGECAAGDYVSIAVGDTGCGMAPEVLERVFEPFFTTKPVGKGTGLGLSQLFGFVRQSGGEIAIDTVVGEGTTVTLFLPRHIGEAEAVTDAEAPAGDAPVRALDILVVEDDPRVLNATVGALTELGHRPVACDDPLAAPALIDGLEALDLIVSDVLMPGQTGPEMITALAHRLDGVGVLFVTGFAGEADANALGGYPVLRKPFTMAALAKAVEGARA
ncbi:ATP-binding protein [Sphingomonas sp. LB-2]|uniref:ATP-binding protein n=1 Tax=Sphingomonas caeni TaxID=2984949 RepID=UPI00222EF71F|nr:ATP-binding protein [Sphingomonas caeni]MCW3848284.1 ATP-binding protein [Sphingomonas caeni]